MKIIFRCLMTVLPGLSLLMTGFPLPADAAQDKDEKRVFTKHFRETLFEVTEKADFSVEILLDDKEYKIGKDVIGIVIHDARDHDVEKAAIRIDFRNLDTGQPSDQSPLVKEKGDGLYTVSNLDLKKEGRWKLTITVRKDTTEDSAQFLFPEVLNKRWPAGRYNP
jgi:hypothetical protein